MGRRVTATVTYDGGGARDGHAHYHVEALERPERVRSWDFVVDDHPLRLAWARASGVRELFDWAALHVDAEGPPRQRKTWNLSGLFRLPTADGPVWVKAIPPFAAAEPAAIRAVAEIDPALVPTVLASAPGRLLMTDVPAEDCWHASAQTVAEVLDRWVGVQARLAPPLPGLPDRRPHLLRAAVDDLLDGPVGAELGPAELGAARALGERWAMLADCAAIRPRRSAPRSSAPTAAVPAPPAAGDARLCRLPVAPPFA